MTVLRRNISPILQFVLLIVPLVMSGFYTVYALTGVILDGRDKFNWSLEAESVAIYVGAGICIFSVLVLAFAKFHGAPRSHILSISGWGHMVLAVLLTVAVFVLVRI